MRNCSIEVTLKLHPNFEETWISGIKLKGSLHCMELENSKGKRPFSTDEPTVKTCAREWGLTMQCGKILVIEDDPTILTLIKHSLEGAQFEVLCEQTGKSGMALLSEAKPDALVLDINLPDMDGLSICREVRKRMSLPVLMLSSQNEDLDKVIGLEVGADDYMGKPFNPRELVARVRALLRRKDGFSLTEEDQIVNCGPIRMDITAHTAKFGETALHLTPTEFNLLKTLISKPGQAFSRQALLDAVWGRDYIGDERIVDVHVRNLRNKLEEVDETPHLQSVRGIGYKWVI